LEGIVWAVVLFLRRVGVGWALRGGSLVLEGVLQGLVLHWLELHGLELHLLRNEGMVVLLIVDFWLGIEALLLPIISLWGLAVGRGMQ
jgi:hypothetical protein